MLFLFVPNDDHDKSNFQKSYAAFKNSILLAIPIKTRCDGGDSCCRPDNPCLENEGDCDENEDCLGELVCGAGTGNDNNCPAKATFESTDDCCYRGKNNVLSLILIKVQLTLNVSI